MYFVGASPPRTPDPLLQVLFKFFPRDGLGWAGLGEWGWGRGGREGREIKDSNKGRVCGVGEEKTGAPGAQDVGAPPLLLPRALGPDRCEGRLRASTTRILHKHELKGLLAGTWVLPFVFSSLPSVPPPLLSHTHGAAVAGSEIADSGSREGPEGPAQWFSKWSSDRPHGAPRDEQVCGWSKHTCA